MGQNTSKPTKKTPAVTTSGTPSKQPGQPPRTSQFREIFCECPSARCTCEHKWPASNDLAGAEGTGCAEAASAGGDVSASAGAASGAGAAAARSQDSGVEGGTDAKAGANAAEEREKKKPFMTLEEKIESILQLGL